MAKYWKVFEQKVARRFRRWFPDARRGLQYQDGDYTPDVVHTPFYVECKSGRSQYLKYRPEKRVVAVRPDDTERMACMYNYYYERMMLWRTNGGEDRPVVIVWSLGRTLMVTLSSSVLAGLNRKCVVETGGLVSVAWDDFAAALDSTYPIQQEIKEIAAEGK